MPLHDKAFYAIFFFLCGVLLASFSVGGHEYLVFSALVTLGVATLFWGALVFAKWKTVGWLTALSIFIFFGSLYYVSYDVHQKAITIPFGGASTFEALIVDVAHGFEGQKVVLELQPPYKGRVRGSMARYPAWEYGDLVSVSGTIKSPSERSARYLEKNGIFGVVSFPKVTLVSKGNGSSVKRGLLRIKDFSERAFARALPPREAAFMSGLTLGETAEFSSEFKEAMRITGTTHLVALSGYNITIIANAVMSLLGLLYLGRRARFVGSIVAIFAFVMMTGAEASVVRAAIMGFIGLLANEVSRAYSFRNAIAIAAFAMVLVNPKVLVWDIGFELSFLALLGLVYVAPAITYFFSLSAKPGVLHWRENLLVTLSAQLAVLPLVLARFGLFSILSLATNVALLTLIPITMSLGFTLIACTLFSGLIARFVGYIAHLFLWYEMSIIDVFAQFKGVAISIDHISVWFAVSYYVALIAFVVWNLRNKRNASVTHA